MSGTQILNLVTTASPGTGGYVVNFDDLDSAVQLTLTGGPCPITFTGAATSRVQQKILTITGPYTYTLPPSGVQYENAAVPSPQCSQLLQDRYLCQLDPSGTITVKSLGMGVGVPNGTSKPTPGTLVMTPVPGGILFDMVGQLINGAAITGYNVKTAATSGAESAVTYSNVSFPYIATGLAATPLYAVAAPINGAGPGNYSAEASATPLASGAYFPTLLNPDFVFDATDTNHTLADSAGNCQWIYSVTDFRKSLGQGNASARPAIITNGGANGTSRALAYSGTSIMESDMGSGSNVGTLGTNGYIASMSLYACFVGKQSAITANQVFFALCGVGGSPDIRFLMTPSAQEATLTTGTGTSYAASDAVAPDTNYHVWELYVTGGTLTLTKDGTSIATVSVSAVTSAFSPLVLLLGASWFTTIANELVGEADHFTLCATAVPSSTLRASHRAYVAAKFGITGVS